jgi:opacity protein-like surface antigen
VFGYFSDRKYHIINIASVCLFLTQLPLNVVNASQNNISPYFSVKGSYVLESGGVSNFLSSIDNLYGGKFAVGVSYNNVRTEAEFTYIKEYERKIDVNNWEKVQSSALFLNLYYDINISKSNFRPYINVGAGKVWGEFESFSAGYVLPHKNFKTNNLGIGFGIGFSYFFDTSLSLDIGYRYVNVGDVEIKDGFFLKTHEFILGTKYNF